MFPFALKHSVAAAVCGCAALLLCGCGAVPINDSVATSAPALSGVVHGGQQPISNAIVSLYAAGNSGYGSVTVPLATTLTGSDGSFTFHPSSGRSYSCPTSGSSTQTQMVYLIAAGGQAVSGVPNSYIGLMAVLGDCKTVLNANPKVTVNEATTIAGMFALQQFYASSSDGNLGYFGTAANNVVGLNKAANTAQALVSLSTGGSEVSTLTGAGVKGFSNNPTVTVTPEIAKINTEADILAACINSNPSSSTTCQTLMQSVSATPPTDTLTAAFDMATNPTSTINGSSQLSTLFLLTNTQSPFQPNLSSAPPDWTLGVTYGSNSTNSTGTYLLNGPQQVAFGSDGYLWVMNNAGSSANSGSSISEFDTATTPFDQELTSLAGPSALVIDPSGNVWVSSFGSSGSPGTTANEFNGVTTSAFTVAAGPTALASDGEGNIFVLSPSDSGGAGAIDEIPAGSTGSVTQIATGLLTGAQSQIGVDGNYTLWISGADTRANEVYQFLDTNNFTQYPSSPSRFAVAPNIVLPTALAIDSQNNVWVTNDTASTLSELSGTTTVSGSTFNTAGLSSPVAIAIDGAGDVWVTNSTGGGAGSVFAYTSAGQALTPSNGFAAHIFNGASGIAIDYAGNIWVANASSVPSSSSQAFLTEIVGEAAPTQPPAVALPSTPAGTRGSWNVVKNR